MFCAIELTQRVERTGWCGSAGVNIKDGSRWLLCVGSIFNVRTEISVSDGSAVPD